jgi:hypothetical protein
MKYAPPPSAPHQAHDGMAHASYPNHENMPVYPNHPPPPYSVGQQMPQVPPPQMAATIIVTTGQSLGAYPQQITCPKCMYTGVSETLPTAGLLAWLIAGGCCLAGLFWGPCLIPCCIDATQDIVHRCANCKTYIGTYKRL